MRTQPDEVAPHRSESDPVADVNPVPRIVFVGAFLAYLGVVFTRFEAPGNVAPVDAILAVFLAYGFFHMLQHRSPVRRTLRRALPFLWLILIGSMLGLLGIGLAPYAIEQLARDFLSVLSFFAMWEVLDRPKLIDAARWGLVVAVPLALVSMAVVGYDHRPQGMFANPNVAAHFIGLSTIFLAMTSRSKAQVIFWVIVGVLGVRFAASFGALSMYCAAGAVVVWRTRRTLSRSGYYLALVGTIILAVASVSFVLSPSNTIDGATGAFGGGEDSVTFGADRFDRSRTGRIEKWQAGWENFVDTPLGIGPDGVVNTGVTADVKELHNDWLAYLVERGILGLVGLFGLWVVLWRDARPGGVARIIIVATLVTTVVREVSHYRHWWLILALAFAWDRFHQPQHSPVDAAAASDPPLPVPT